MLKIKKEHAILILILMVNLFLNIYGIDWGLPDRWNVDESVAQALHMAANRSLIPEHEFYQPTLYYLFLIIIMAPYIFFLKITGYPLETVTEAARVSWLKVSLVAPDFATNIFLVSRISSCLLGVLTVYMVYKIGRLMFDKEAGLFSMAVLSVNAGFAAINHFAKRDSLVNLLILVTAFYCLKAVSGKKFNKYISLASLFAGLSMSAKYNSGILIFPLIATVYLHEIKNKGIESLIKLRSLFNRTSLMMIGYYFLGIIMGWPGLFFNFDKYINQLAYYKRSVFSAYYGSSQPYIANFINYLIQIIIIFGLPLFIFSVIGLFNQLKKVRNINNYLIIIMTVVIPYVLIISSFRHLYHVCTRYIIAIIPFLCLFAGKAIVDLLRLKINRIFRYSFIGIVFIYSFFYALKIQWQFAKNDTRYHSTQWVLMNVPAHSIIAVFERIDWLVSASRIIPQYNIEFYGKNSADYDTRSQFKDYPSGPVSENYFAALNTHGSDYDYIMLIYENISDIPYGLNMKGASEQEKFIRSLVNNRLEYRLIKQFSHPNDKLKSRFFKGLSYPRSIFWNPNLTSYTSPTIMIFKKI